MALKNWTTTFETIKLSKGGFSSYSKYLKNEQHRNHDNDNHRVVDFGINPNKVYVENQKIIDKFNYDKILKNQGGRPSKSMGVSVVLSYPFKIEDDELLKKFYDKIILQFYKDICKMKKLKFDKNSFIKYKSLIFANAHTKDSGSMTQINLTLPHYIPHIVQKKKIEKGLISDKEVLVDKMEIKKVNMTERKYSFLMKELNNQITLDIFHKDFRTWEVQSREVQKKRQKLNVYKSKNINDKEKEIQKRENILEMDEAKLSKQFDFIKSRAFRLQQNMKTFEAQKIEDNTLKKYIERLNKKLRENMSNDEITKAMDVIEKRIDKVASYHSIDFEM